MADPAVLVFPAGMPSSLVFAHKMRRSGRRVLGASSLAHDPESARYPQFAKLPWVLDPEFDSALTNLIAEQDVEEIFSPHPVVWERIAVILPSVSAKIYLHPQDWDADFAAYAHYFETARGFVANFKEHDCLPSVVNNLRSPSTAPLRSRLSQRLSSRRRTVFLSRRSPPRGRRAFKEHAQDGRVLYASAPAPNLSLIAGLVRLFELTPGQCSHTKLEALISIFPSLPRGDLVEIGTLFGRSALALAFLARYYDVGRLLCADPWSSAHLVQGTEAVDQHSGKVPIEAVFQAFLANLAPWHGKVNYLRLPSAEAAEHYSRHDEVQSPEFGVTRYTRHISLLHLDGNHAFDAIQTDVRLWTPFVQPGGWIIFDDYRWPFGDGPRRVADEFCQKQQHAWSTAFEAGGALFVRLSEQIEPVA